jgi:serine protease Do
MRLSYQLAIGLILASLTVSPVRAAVDDPPAPRNSARMLAAFKPVVAKASKSTVRVKCQAEDVVLGKMTRDAALGAVVRADGYILTKASELTPPFVGELKSGKPVQVPVETILCVLKSGKEYKAKVVGIDDKNDLALLHIDAKDLTPIEWVDRKKDEPAGSWVASPGPGEIPVAVGVVSVPTRTLTGLDRALSGRTAPPPNSGFLGIGIEPAPGGAKISAVEDRGPADRIGIKPGDVVLTVAGSKVADPEQLVKLIQAFKPGDQVLLKIKRGDEEMEFKPTLTKRPNGGFDRGDFQNSLGSTLSTRRGGFATILQHDTIIRPSDCGGPLVDLDGKAVGLNIARAGRVESYALPAELVKAELPDLLSGKLAPKSADVLKAKDWQRKYNAAEAAVQRAEDRVNAAKKDDDAEELAAARKELKEAKAALEKLKAEGEK